MACPRSQTACACCREQAQRTPPGQWVRVVGGWSEFQFAERRMPTLDEINAAAPDTPVFILHLYCRALLNKAALARLRLHEGHAESARRRNPARPAGQSRPACSSRAPTPRFSTPRSPKGPKLPPEHQMNSTRHFMRELNRLGLTSIIDAGGGFQNYPEDYAVIEELHKRGELTSAHRLQSLHAKTKAGEGRLCALDQDDRRRARATISFAATARAKCWSSLRPTSRIFSSHGRISRRRSKANSKKSSSLLAANKWPFRLHATYDESITRFLNVFEEVNRDVPFKGLNWFFDHCETISDRNLERVKALGGGIAIQHRMAYQGEYFMERYGKQAAERTPPVRRMLELGIPVGAGTDATRVASYNPWVSLYWLITGKTVGGISMYPEANRLSREEALAALHPRQQLVLQAKPDRREPLLSVNSLISSRSLRITSPCRMNRSRSIESVLTIVDGKVVHATEEFSQHAPPPIPVLPEWSPVAQFGGYGAPLHTHSSCIGAPVPSARACAGVRIVGNGLRVLYILTKVKGISMNARPFLTRFRFRKGHAEPRNHKSGTVSFDRVISRPN